MNDLSSEEVLKHLKEEEKFHETMRDAYENMISTIEIMLSTNKFKQSLKPMKASSHLEDALRYQMKGEKCERQRD